MNVVDNKSAEDIGKLLAHVKKPSRYVGNEFNVFRKDWDSAALRIVFVFPDLYEIGMSHHGLQILYSVINSQDDLLADRAYAPDKDLEELLRSRGRMLFAVESRRVLADFDMIGFTLPYELCYTNILTVLDLSGIPLRAAERMIPIHLSLVAAQAASIPSRLQIFLMQFFWAMARRLSLKLV